MTAVATAWSNASDERSGVDGFSFEWSRAGSSEPDTTKDAEESVSGTSSPVLAVGEWWFHLRTRDNAGNWSSAVHLGPFVIESRRPTSRCVVPNVRGKTLRAARAAIVRGKCRMGRVQRRFSSRVKAGRVISQRPRAGARLAANARVHVVVSKGKRR